MLVLARKQGQSLILKTPDETQIKVLILGTKNGHAKIGVDAPSDIEILRDELLKANYQDSKSALSRYRIYLILAIFI